MNPIRTLAAAAGLCLAQAAGAAAQLPPGVYAAQKSAAAAPAGAYDLDPGHTAVLAKVSHLGYSLSVFRFNQVHGALEWNPAQPSQSSLQVTVDTASIATPVPGFAEELSGSSYLNAGAYPTATFVSTAFHRIDASHGQVDGQFTLMGRTRPVSFNVELMGAGKGFGHPRIGVEAVGRINPQDYGLSAMFSTPIQLVIDAEFAEGS